MPWTKQTATLTAKVGLEDLRAAFRFDDFGTGEKDANGKPITERALRCDFTIAVADGDNETIGFRLDQHIDLAAPMKPTAFLAACRGIALSLAGYVES